MRFKLYMKAKEFEFPNAIHNTNFSLVVVVGVVNIIEQWNRHREANANVHKYDMFHTNLTKMLFKTLCSSVFFCSKNIVVLLKFLQINL